MKKFIILQLCIVLVGTALCSFLGSSRTDAGFLDIKSGNELKNINAAIEYVLSEEDTVTDMTAEEFVQGMYDFLDIREEMYGHIVFTAEVCDDITLYDKGIMQKLKVTSVIDGEGAAVGETVDFYYVSGFHLESEEECSTRVSHYAISGTELADEFKEPQLLYTMYSGMNVMKSGDEYLIFALTVDMGDYTIIEGGKRVYQWMDITGGQSDITYRYGSYSESCENEIFADSYDVIDGYYDLKEAVLRYFGLK